ncbi:MAG TPA: class E sortase [Micromonosporaceae bacterium]|nr:class E sortase [Micromonosporaceae bacterium]
MNKPESESDVQADRAGKHAAPDDSDRPEDAPGPDPASPAVGSARVTGSAKVTRGARPVGVARPTGRATLIGRAPLVGRAAPGMSSLGRATASSVVASHPVAAAQPVVASHPVVATASVSGSSGARDDDPAGSNGSSAAEGAAAESEYRGRRRARETPDEVDWEAELGQVRSRRRAADETDQDETPPRSRDRVAILHTGIRGLGELLITFGLVILLFAGYEVWGKSAQVDAAQNELDTRLEDAWRGGGGPGDIPKEKPLPGAAIARLHIPRLDKHLVVVEGVAPGDIKNAPGHYPNTAMPGKVGNFAVAGHRMPAVFWNLHKMQPGDQIFLEDRQNWYEYQVTETKIVLPGAVEVVAPVPGKPGAKPTEAMLTLTTCNPQWDNYERLIVHGKYVDVRPKSQGRPDGLAKGD